MSELRPYILPAKAEAARNDHTIAYHPLISEMKIDSNGFVVTGRTKSVKKNVYKYL